MLPVENIDTLYSQADLINSVGEKFTHNFKKLLELGMKTGRRALFGILSISLMGLILAGCKGDGPTPVYSEIFDPSMVELVASKCIIPPDVPREVIDSYTPPAGGVTWFLYHTPDCEGWGLR